MDHGRTMATNPDNPTPNETNTPGTGLRFDDPKAERRSKGFKRMPRKTAPKVPTPAKDRVITPRLDEDLLEEISADPNAHAHRQLLRMIAKEQRINEDLYDTDPPDDKAISGSNKRLMDLYDNLKALPKQSNETAQNQKSLAELIADALVASPEWGGMTAEEAVFDQMQMDRANTAFGDGA